MTAELAVAPARNMTVSQLRARSADAPDDQYANLAVVVGAHPQAGTSTVAMALADALAQQAPEVRLVDTAAAASSGLIAVTDQERGDLGTGWRMGRRGRVLVERPSAFLTHPMELPDFELRPAALTVIDAAWPASILEGSWLGLATRRGHLVVVFRASVPGAARVENVLAGMHGSPLLVAVGDSRLPGVVLASGGRHVAAAHRDGRVVCLPRDRRLATYGLDRSVLTKPVRSAGASIAATLWPERGGGSR